MKMNSTMGEDAVKLTLSKIVTLGIYMLAGMLISRFRTLEEYGTYSQLQLTVSVISSFLMLGLPNSINYFLSKARTLDEENQFLSTYYTTSTIISILIGFAMALSVGIIEKYFNNPSLASFKYFLFLYPWATITMHSIDNVMVIHKKIDVLMMFKVAYGGLTVLVIILNHVLKHSFSKYMIAFTVLNIIAGIAVIALVNDSNHNIKAYVNIDLLKNILTYSIPLGISSLVGTLNSDIDKAFIGYITSTEKLAIYANAARELPISIIPGSVSAVLIPIIIKMVQQGRVKESIDRWKIAVELSFIVICFMVVGVFTYAPEVIEILYSSKYLPGVSVFRIYTLNLLLRVTYFGLYLNAFGKTKKVLESSIVALIVNIIMNPVLYYLFGIVGPAIATFLSIFTMQMMQLHKTVSLVNCSSLEIMPWGNMVRCVGVNAIFAVFFWVLKRVVPLNIYIGEIIESVLLGIIWTFLYIVFYKKKLLLLWNRLNSSST